jgi:hypothetical protein
LAEDPLAMLDGLVTFGTGARMGALAEAPLQTRGAIAAYRKMEKKARELRSHPTPSANGSLKPRVRRRNFGVRL